MEWGYAAEVAAALCIILAIASLAMKPGVTVMIRKYARPAALEFSHETKGERCADFVERDRDRLPDSDCVHRYEMSSENRHFRH
jgi:hypothetical protein